MYGVVVKNLLNSFWIVAVADVSAKQITSAPNWTMSDCLSVRTVGLRIANVIVVSLFAGPGWDASPTLVPNSQLNDPRTGGI